MAELSCFRCKTPISWSAQAPISRRDSCPKCGVDVRVCMNCRHYDAAANRECREHIPEAVRDKERGNMCDAFQAKDQLEAGATVTDPRSEAMKMAEALFKKK